MRLIPPTTCSRCSDAKVAYGSDGSGKVRRQSRFGLNLPPMERIQPENLALPATRLKGIRQRKQATDGKSEDKKRNGLQVKQNFDTSSVSRSFFLFAVSPLLSQIIGQTANCAPSRKSDDRLSVGGAVAVKQHFLYVRLAVEYLAAQLDIGYPSLDAIILECPTAYLQSCRHFLVGEETLSAQCRAIVGSQSLVVVQQSVETAHEVDNPLVVFGHQFVHVTLDLVGIVILLCLLFVLSFP